MNEVALHHGRGSIVPVAEIKDRMVAIHQLVEGAMQDKVHYGVIPGTPKPSLWKPGAELICSMFRIAVRYETEDLSRNGDAVHYRVRCLGYSPDGTVLGEGLGEASSDEEKYKWRRAVCDEEWEETPQARRRIAYKKGSGGSHYTIKQIRTEYADSANTILKMACKRAHVAMTLTVAGCSDFFSQDIEDTDLAPDQPAPAPRQRPAAKTATRTAAPSDMAGERAWLESKAKVIGLEVKEILIAAGLAADAVLTPENFPAVRAEVTRLLADV